MAYSLVGSVNVPGGANGGTSGSLDTTGATLLVAQVASYAGSAAPAFSDSKGNTWSALTTYASAEDPRTIIYYVVNPTVGTGHTFTTSGASSYCVAGIEAWSGGDTTSPFDVENGNALTGSHTTIQPGSVTPSNDNSLIIASFGGDRFASSISIDSGFTTTEVDNGVGGTNIGGALAYLVQGSAAAINPTWSNAASTYGVAAAIAVFKPASGSSPNVDLTAVSGTGAVAGFTPSVAFALGAVSGTGAVGGLTPSVAASLAGVAGTGAVGGFTATDLFPLGAVSGSGGVGDFATALDISIPLEAVAAVGAVRNFAVSGGGSGRVIRATIARVGAMLRRY